MTFIKALGYLGLGVSDLGEWEHFLINTIGVMASQSLTDQLDLRVDDYAWRIRLIRDPADDILFAGWEVSNADDLLALKERLLANEIVVHNGDDELKADRRVKELIWFEDPDGLRTEVFYGPLQLTQHPFVSPHGTTYNTGEQGLGHIVLATKNIEAQRAFYENVLEFKVSDFIDTEVVPGRPLSITFLRCNGRHHSLALAPLPLPKRLVHMMLETNDIDCVGRAMYRVIDENRHLSFTLGRHSNDEMLSFYVMTPSGFDLEYGWGGLEVFDETWHVKTHNVNSAWGHMFQRPPKKGS